ncbi:hypothetical protein [Ancylobacter lacus]|uniref:hypothetical protein n=1 Tax=Ancylobacter lacus TaxID=2579970 RepID=UPI001BCC52CA|nr:hypothetical protein [Ancylobacter lacus]MBS7540350.1 hypothetical protein [Ancylobacter lacus]
MPSSNIVERLRAMAADIAAQAPEQVENQLSEAADVIELLRREIDRLVEVAGEPTPPEPHQPQA